MSKIFGDTFSKLFPVSLTSTLYERKLLISNKKMKLSTVETCTLMYFTTHLVTCFVVWVHFGCIGLCLCLCLKIESNTTNFPFALSWISNLFFLCLLAFSLFSLALFLFIFLELLYFICNFYSLFIVPSLFFSPLPLSLSLVIVASVTLDKVGFKHSHWFSL